MKVERLKWVKARKSRGFTIVELATVVCVIGVLAAIAIPNYVHARENSQKSLCLNNLRDIDDAKQQWALENSKVNGDRPLPVDIIPYFKGQQLPTCPKDGTYSLGEIGSLAVCNIAGHSF